MPTVHFGKKDEPGFQLVESPDLIVVRTRSELPLRARGPVLQPAAAEVVDGERVAVFEDAGVEVFRVQPKNRSLEDRKLALRATPDVRFAGSVLVDPKTSEPVLYTENIYIRFQDSADADDCEQVIQEAGLKIKQQVPYAMNAYVAEAPEGTGQRVFEIANKLLKRPDVVYCHPELIRERSHKQIFAQQWHLKPTTIGSATINAHSNVEAAHAVSTGRGITIAVIDDGCDTGHPEFIGAGKIVAPRDATNGNSDPRPRSGDNHGTACSGVACAAGIDGASGVAPDARLMPIRLASGLGSTQEADAFRWAADNGADVISCSWGPVDGRWFDPQDPRHTQLIPLPASTRDAIDYCVTQGRGGKGCVVLFAAGNGNESVEMDGYAKYENVIAVAACNDRGTRSVYSDFGESVWCAFPSNDMGHAPFNHPEPLTTGIWTTDRRGTSGYNPGDARFGDAVGNYANDFGGTSSACPGAAGVAALVLGANSQLRWTEVREILKKSCDRIDPANGEYDASGHSKRYGYGRLNAQTAVAQAKGARGRLLIINKLLMEPIPDLGRVEGTLDVTDETAIEKLVVQLNIEHTYIGDLVITLIPPSGRGLSNVVLHNRQGGRTRDIDRLYGPDSVPGLSRFTGKKCHGTWTIRVEDRAARDSGTLVQFSLQLSLPPAAGAEDENDRSTPRKSVSKAKKPRRASARPALRTAARRTPK
jgi:subtilisin family serine protease